jgi:hypothetical protein
MDLERTKAWCRIDKDKGSRKFFPPDQCNIFMETRMTCFEVALLERFDLSTSIAHLSFTSFEEIYNQGVADDFLKKDPDLRRAQLPKLDRRRLGDAYFRCAGVECCLALQS